MPAILAASQQLPVVKGAGSRGEALRYIYIYIYIIYMYIYIYILYIYIYVCVVCVLFCLFFTHTYIWGDSEGELFIVQVHIIS